MLVWLGLQQFKAWIAKSLSFCTITPTQTYILFKQIRTHIPVTPVTNDKYDYARLQLLR